MPLRRDDVIEAALALLDEGGLDGLTTRRLADRLGVQVGALYWHVRDKRELLVCLAERIIGEVAPTRSESGDWAEQLSGGAHALRAAMLRHRDGARIVAAYGAECERSLRLSEEGLHVLRSWGIPLAAAAHVGDAVMSYVTGFVLQEQTMPAPPGVDRLTGFPLLAEWTVTRPAASRDEAFAAGVELLVTGIRETFFDGERE